MAEKDYHRFVTLAEAMHHFGLSRQQLLKWEKNGRIKTERVTLKSGGHRRFDLASYVHERVTDTRINIRERGSYCYFRTENPEFDKELDREKRYLKLKYPSYQQLEDYGSGEDSRRKMYRLLLRDVMSRKVAVIIVTSKDAIATHPSTYLLYETVCKEHGVTIKVAKIPPVSEFPYPDDPSEE